MVVKQMYVPEKFSSREVNLSRLRVLWESQLGFIGT